MRLLTFLFLIAGALFAQCEQRCRCCTHLLCVVTPNVPQRGQPAPTDAEIKDCEACVRDSCGGSPSSEPEAPQITDPTADMQLDSMATFKWTKGRRIVRYQFVAGWERGGQYFFNSGWLTAQQVTVQIPQDQGKTVHVALRAVTDDGKDLIDTRHYSVLGKATLGKPRTLDDYFGVAAGVAGTWRLADGSDLVMTQSGNQVEGRYKGGTLSGVLDRDILLLRYSQAGGSGSCSLRATSPDLLEGSCTSATGGPARSWRLARVAPPPPPPNLNLGGRWVGADGVVFSFSQDRDRVTATYVVGSIRGYISGVLRGNVVSGTFQTNNASGTVTLSISSDGRRLTGAWTDRNGYSSSWYLSR